MVCCSAFGCSNRTDRKKTDDGSSESAKISFHQFPKDLNMHKKWVQAVRRANWEPTIRSVLCSVHFSKDCFDHKSESVTRLWPHALPSIFPAFSTYLKVLQKRGRSGQKKNAPVVTAPPSIAFLASIVETELAAINAAPTRSLPATEEVSQEVPSTSSVKYFCDKTTSYSPDCCHRYGSPSPVKI